MYEQLIDSLKQLRDGLKIKDITVIRHSTEAIISAINKIWDRFSGPPVMSESAAFAAQVGEARLLANECLELMESQDHPALNVAEMTAIGDGKLLELLKLVLPIVLKFLI
jgi:hypothetical protein